MSSFRIQKKSRRLKQYSLWQLRFCQAQKPWKRKETERTYSLRAALRGRDGEEEEPLASVVFPPSTIAKQCTKRHAAAQASHWSLWLPSMLSRLENGCIHAQAPRIAEPKHSRQQIDTWVRGDDVLAKEHCLYERDRRLRSEDEKTSQCNVRVVTFFSPKLTKTSSIRDRLLLSSKRSSLSLYRLRDVWALTEKQPVSTSLGVFRREVARTDLPRKNLNEKTSAYMIVRELGERVSSSSSEESRVLACAIFFFDFLSKLVRSWRRLICREMTGISRHVDQKTPITQYTSWCLFFHDVIINFLSFIVGLISRCCSRRALVERSLCLKWLTMSFPTTFLQSCSYFLRTTHCRWPLPKHILRPELFPGGSSFAAWKWTLHSYHFSLRFSMAKATVASRSFSATCSPVWLPRKKKKRVQASGSNLQVLLNKVRTLGSNSLLKRRTQGRLEGDR